LHCVKFYRKISPVSVFFLCEQCGRREERSPYVLLNYCLLILYVS
jgi:hypothetical protein